MEPHINDESEQLVEQVDPDADGIFQMITKVEAQTFLYDSKDPRHSKRDVLTSAWMAIAKDLEVNGKSVTAIWCKKKWKQLKDYYFRTKKQLKGKSGKGRLIKKPWLYYAAMDRVLSTFVEENENTQSNLEGVDSEQMSKIQDQDSNDDDESANQESVVNDESTQKPITPINKSRKRRMEAEEQILNERILKALEEPEEMKDEHYHFGMTVANKLRKLPAATADYAMTRITSLMYEIAYPQWNNGGSHIPSD